MRAVAAGLHPAPEQALGSIPLVQNGHLPAGPPGMIPGSLRCWVALCRLVGGEIPAGPRGRLECGRETPPAARSPAPAPNPRRGAQRPQEQHCRGGAKG